MWLTVGAGLLVYFSSGADTLTPDDRTTYVCYNGKCITKATLNESVENVTLFQSMESCRLLCGKFGNLWPLPTSSGELGNELVGISPGNIRMTVDCCGQEVQKYLDSAFLIFRDALIGECGAASIVWSNTQVSINVKVSDESLVLNRSTNEEYSLIVTKRSGELEVKINANSVYGARHSFETLSQLISRWINPTRNTCSVYMMTAAHIRDKPVFGHRGILVDTSRNFIPLADLKRTIDAMGANKLNVLHWHATDSHSFPLLINRVSALAEMGSYSPQEVYTEEDIKNLVEYAKLRGVRILMEIDSPAHAGNGWQFGEKQGLGKLVVCRNQDPWRSACVQPPCGQLNPSNPNVYSVLQELFRGLKDLIPSDDIFHMGGDEVHLGCWNQSQEIVDYMKTKGYPRTVDGFIRLWSEFHSRALDAWDKAVGHKNTKIILWTSDLTNPFAIEDSLDKSRFIIEAWTDQYDRVPSELLRLGYEVIFATTDTWYLDHGFWGRTKYHSWKEVYDYKIPEDPKVLGGEAPLWTEYVDTNSIDTRIWPRAAALAERLWASPSTSAVDAEYRLLEMRQRLIRRGIQVEQIVPQWCYLNEGLCKL